MKRAVAALICLLVAAPALASSWEATAAKVKRSVQRMEITVDGQEGVCTAFSINDLRDYFLTAAHCFGEKMTVGGHEARLVLYDASADLMVLMVPESGEVPAIQMAKLRNCPDGTRDYVCQGQEVGGMGYGGGGLIPLFKAGPVMYPDALIPEWFGEKEHQMLVGWWWIGGMSGGPVVNQDGKLVSIVQWDAAHYNFGGGRTLGRILEVIAPYLK